MRIGLVLSLVAVAAFLVGRWTAPERERERARESGGRAAASAPVAPPVSPSPLPARPDASVVAPSASTPEGETPPSAPRSSGARATLRVRGLDRAEDWELLARDLRGEWAEPRGDFDDTGVPFPFPPGAYRLRVEFDGEIGSRLYEFDLLAGTTRTVDVARPPTPDLFPLKEGLGRVDVQIRGVDGTPLPDVDVILRAGDADVRGSTKHSGWIRFDVVPGEYGVFAGALRRRLAVVAGKRRRVTFQARETAEIVLTGLMYHHVSVGAADRKPAEWNTIRVGSRTVRHVLLPPGRYEFTTHLQPGNQPRLLHTATLAAGDVYRYEPEQVGVFVVLTCEGPDGPVRVPVRVSDAEGRSSMVASSSATLFERGAYSASVATTFWTSEVRRFEVTESETTVRIPVSRR